MKALSVEKIGSLNLPIVFNKNFGIAILAQIFVWRSEVDCLHLSILAPSQPGLLRQHLLLEHWETLHWGHVGCGHQSREEELEYCCRAPIKGGLWWWLATKHRVLEWFKNRQSLVLGQQVTLVRMETYGNYMWRCWLISTPFPTCFFEDHES